MSAEPYPFIRVLIEMNAAKCQREASKNHFGVFKIHLAAFKIHFGFAPKGKSLLNNESFSPFFLHGWVNSRTFAVYYSTNTLIKQYNNTQKYKEMIDIKDISYRYPGQKQQVFDRFSLELTENRIYGLLGKNGTGKSTLLYLIAGLLHPKAGSVCIDGTDAYKRKAEVLQEIFLVSEEFVLPTLSLDKYVQLLLPFYPRFSREMLDRCLEAFELPKQLQLNQLSMGQKKKVFMSIALAANTKLLLMDEPTNGLDIPSKSQFRKVVAECMSDDRTIIISTHQVHDVEQLLDHILILSEREMLLDASMADITDRYVFEVRMPGNLDDSIIYAEPSLQGNLVMARREEGQAETLVNLELLFNAVTKGLVK